MKKSFLSVLKEPVCGFFMAVADSVPGVSGGTVAFLAGVYGDFIGSFGNIVGKDKEKRKKSLRRRAKRSAPLQRTDLRYTAAA